MKKRTTFTKPVFTFILALSLSLIFISGIQKAAQALDPVTIATITTGSCDCKKLTISSHNFSGLNPLLLVATHLTDGDKNKKVKQVKIVGGKKLKDMFKDLKPDLKDGVVSNDKVRTQLFYLQSKDNPADGDYDIQVEIDKGNSNKMAVGVITFNGVKQNLPFGVGANSLGSGTVATSAGNSDSDTLVIGSTVNNLVMDIVSFIEDITPGAGQEEQWDLEIGGNGVSGQFGGASIKQGTTTVQMSYTFSKEDEFTHAMININAVTDTGMAFCHYNATDGTWHQEYIDASGYEGKLWWCEFKGGDYKTKYDEDKKIIEAEEDGELAHYGQCLVPSEVDELEETWCEFKDGKSSTKDEKVSDIEDKITDKIAAEGPGSHRGGCTDHEDHMYPLGVDYWGGCVDIATTPTGTWSAAYFARPPSDRSSVETKEDSGAGNRPFNKRGFTPRTQPAIK